MSLIARNLTVGYRSGHSSRSVLSGIDADLRPATLTVLLGANGSGKSTLLRTLAGIQSPLAGAVELEGRDLSCLAASARARLLASVFTDRTHGGGLTVEETVAVGRQPYTGFFGTLAASDRRAVADAVAAVGLRGMERRFMATLSDGERQKVMIARALAQATPVVLLDEPTSFLDVAARFEVMSLLRMMVSEMGKTVLLSTHDVGPALAVADDVWAVEHGSRALVCGPKDSVIASGVMDRVFAAGDIVFDSVGGNYRYGRLKD